MAKSLIALFVGILLLALTVLGLMVYKMNNMDEKAASSAPLSQTVSTQESRESGEVEALEEPSESEESPESQAPLEDQEPGKSQTTRHSQEPPESSASAASPGSGGIKGAITWQYDKSTGTKPDDRAKILLIPLRQAEKSVTTDDLLTLTAGSKKKSRGVYGAIANDNGEFEITTISGGEYRIIVISAQTFKDPQEKIDGESIEKYFKEWDDALLLFLSLRKSTIQSITIANGETVDFSHDFGFSY